MRIVQPAATVFGIGLRNEITKQMLELRAPCQLHYSVQAN